MMIIIRSSYTIPDDDNHDDERDGSREVFIVFVYFFARLFVGKSQRKKAPKRDKRRSLQIFSDLSETALKHSPFSHLLV